MKPIPTVYVAVHPHNAYGIYDRDKPYAEKRDLRLLNETLQHVVLVDQPDVPPEEHLPDIVETEKKLDLQSNYWRGRIFLTHGGKFATEYSNDKRLGYPELSRTIRERFPAEEYIFWGAELHKPPSDLKTQSSSIRTIWERRNMQPYGCVVSYHSWLDLPNKKIDEDYCHILNF